MNRVRAGWKRVGRPLRRLGRRAAVCLLAVFLPACVAHQLSPEEAARLSRWHPIDLVEAELNLPILLSQRITESERRVKEEGIVEDRLRLEVNKGRIVTSFVPEASFAAEFSEQLENAEFFSARMIETFDRIYDQHSEFRKIRHKTRNSGGFAAVVNLKDRRKRCFYAIVGYRMKGAAFMPGDFGTFDTVVTMYYCDPAVEFGVFEAALEAVEQVTDRVEFAEALRRKVKAAPGGTFRGGGLEA